MVALYRIVEQFRDLNRAADEETSFDPVAIRDTLEGLIGDFEDKAEAIACVIRNLESTADMIEESARRQNERADALRKRSAFLRTYLLGAMTLVKKRKIQSPLFLITVRLNPPTAKIIDEKLVPPDYWVQPQTPPAQLDKRAILEVLKAGKEVAGAALIQGERLDIRL